MGRLSKYGSTDSLEAGLASRLATQERIGHGLVEETIALRIAGMTCASCVGRVERALNAVPGVTAASVNLATERAAIRGSGSGLERALTQAVLDAGYEAEPIEDGADARDRERTEREAALSSLWRSVLLAGAAAIPLMIVEMGAHLFPEFHHFLAARLGSEPIAIASFLLASIVQFGPGLRFYTKGWPALMRGAPDMNALVMLGTSAAYGYSVVASFAPTLLPEGLDHTYFEAGAVIVTLILLGRWFEAKAKGRTSVAIQRLLTLQAKTARVVRAGVESEIEIAELRLDDVIAVRPGERLAVDGEVIDGASYVDEAMITGEPTPKYTTVGSSVIGGTVNGTGAFRFRATKLGADTLLAQIVRVVETAQASKLPIQALVDRVTHWFVPLVILLAIVTFLAWLIFAPAPALALALVNAVSVLIIACPCAMGLATPTSIMVGTGRAAELGILFRKGEALQTLKEVTVVALDKTGTITKGHPELTDLVVIPGQSEDPTLRLIASVESRSEHPIAQAIVGGATHRGLILSPPVDFAAEPGFGVTGIVDGHPLAVGAARLMSRLGVSIAPFAAQAERLANDGKTPLYAAIDGRLAAIVAVADPIKDTTPAAIAALRDVGMRVVMITGDDRRTALAIARQLGIEEVEAEVLPIDKAAVIARLQADGGTRVAFVGDGINDAPALARADIGIAIGTGTDIAIESADVVLMSGDLRNVPTAIALSRATIANIHENLAWAFGYNFLLIPVAAGALYPAFGILMSPVFSGFAMAISSVSVVTNALRLRRFAPAQTAKSGSGK